MPKTRSKGVALFWRHFPLSRRISVIKHPLANQVHAHALDGYFGSLRGLSTRLLVADVRRLVCFDAEASLLWAVDLGVDGVIFDVKGEIVVGEAEIDPPGGWVPFRVALQTGERLQGDAEEALR